MKNTKKLITMVCALALTAAIAIGGTLAYLTAETKTVTNTFTVGKIEATLDETDADNSTADKDRDTENSYKIIPGDQLVKDPTVHVLEGSEKCWVYVCINDELNAAVAGSAKYTVENGWTLVNGTKNIYKYNNVVDASEKQQDLVVFNGVTIDGAVVTEDNIDDLDEKTIVVNAYLHQADNLGDSVNVDALAVAHFTA